MLMLTTQWVIRTTLHKRTRFRFAERSLHTITKGHSVLFFGSDKFSLPSLKELFLNSELNNNQKIRTSNYKAIDPVGIKKLEVVTSLKSPDNAVHKYAKQMGIRLHDWPVAQSDEICSSFDIGIVVSFGHLIPERIISAFPLGMINVHASLLPKWRGAAPVIYAIMNGDQTTGVSIMKIRPKHFDIGEVLAQKEVPIPPDMMMPELHRILSEHGATLLLDSVRQLPGSLERAKPQDGADVQYAPKVTAVLAEIDWSRMTALQVYNRYRALYSYKRLTTRWQGTQVKLDEIHNLIDICKEQTDCGIDRRKSPGHVEYDRARKQLRVLCADRKWIIVDRLSVSGKRTMSAADFHNGFLQKCVAVGQIPCFDGTSHDSVHTN